jgi:phasin family protein
MAAKKSTATSRTTTPVKVEVAAVKSKPVAAAPVAKAAVAAAPVAAAPVVKAAVAAAPVAAASVVKAAVAAAPVAAAPVVKAAVAAAPIAAALVEAPIEDVVGVSPVMETLKTNMTELPASISGVVTKIEKSIETTKTEVKNHMSTTIKSAEDLVAFNQGNVEAFLKSSQIWATGLQDLGKLFAATAQAQIDESVATVKALTSVKSLKEAVDLQSSLAKSTVEKLVAESGKLSDASLKLAEQALAPLTARVTLAAEKFGKAA